MQEMFNKELEEIKKSQSIMNKAITESKDTLEGTNNKITEAEVRTSEVEDRMVEINEAERKKQRNFQQVKEYAKCPPNQTKEKEIGSLPEKEFRIIIVK